VRLPRAKLANSVTATADELKVRKATWVDARRRENAEGIYRARSLSLPLPPSFHDGLRVPRAARSVIAELDASCVAGSVGAVVEMLGVLESAGATALSVAGDGPAHEEAYQAVLLIAQFTTLPILLREMVLDPLQIAMARAHGAAAVVLDPALHGERELRTLCRAASDLGLDAIVTIRTVSDLEQAARLRRVSADPFAMRLLGVGCHRPVCGDADEAHFAKLAMQLPEDVVGIVMADVTSADIAVRLSEHGYEALLVRVDLADRESVDRMRIVAGSPTFA